MADRTDHSPPDARNRWACHQPSETHWGALPPSAGGSASRHYWLRCDLGPVPPPPAHQGRQGLQTRPQGPANARHHHWTTKYAQCSPLAFLLIITAEAHVLQLKNISQHRSGILPRCQEEL